MALESFFLMGAKSLVVDSPIWKLHQLIDWDAVSRKLKGLYRPEDSHGGGSEPYAPLSLLKFMRLGQWHGLSDVQLEQALKVRIDFMVIPGSSLPPVNFPTPAPSADSATDWWSPNWTKCSCAASTANSNTEG